MDTSTDKLFDEHDVPVLWNLSLFSFVLAGFTGFLYRLTMINGLAFSLNVENVRHAHSHLMFFGWAVPLPLYILFHYLREKAPRHSMINLMKNAILCGLILGLAAYPFFLFYGYQPVTIGSASLPLSVMLAGLVMISWYCFMFGYLKIRHVLDDDHRQQWFDGGLIMLFICSLGAWGVAMLQAVDPTNQLFTKAMTHFFLATFTEGWGVLIVIAIIISRLKPHEFNCPVPVSLPLAFILIGAPLTFPYGISESLLTPLLLNTARIGGAMTAVGLFLILYGIIRSTELKNSVWIWPTCLLALKALMQLTASVLPSDFWMSDHGLRIFYLHTLLLGAVTLSVAGTLWEKARIPKFFFNLLAGAVVTVLLSLIPLTRFWPVALNGSWIFYAAAAVALLPILATLLLWFKMLIKKSPKIYA